MARGKTTLGGGTGVAGAGWEWAGGGRSLRGSGVDECKAYVQQATRSADYDSQINRWLTKNIPDTP